MPVAITFSRLFHDRLGEEIARDPIDVFNQLDSSYRTELREINELNYARFDAKLDQRIAELRAELKDEIASLRTDLKGEMATLGADLRGELGGLRTGQETGLAGLRTEFAELKAYVEKGFKEHTRWMFLAWASLLIPIIGLWMRG